jgi:hypothetical protein
MPRNSRCLKNAHAAKYTLDSAPLSGPFWPMKPRVCIGRDVDCGLEFADFHLVGVDEGGFYDLGRVRIQA